MASGEMTDSQLEKPAREPADSPLIVRMDTVHDAITEPVRRLEVFTEPVVGGS